MVVVAHLRCRDRCEEDLPLIQYPVASQIRRYAESRRDLKATAVDREDEVEYRK